ncbi:hypothetical protein [Streptomyces sp. NPDC052107]|uniref:hypothetical protein n=1 Tax=Streptomyces sp. NPDC052107 TaxID=3155632 RepID=UPI0034402C89
MNVTQTEGLLGMIAVIGILGLLVLPAVIGIVHDKIIDRQIGRAQQEEATKEAKGSNRPRGRHGVARPV